MEKLVELLNEYDEDWRIGRFGLYKWEEYETMEEYIISKKFGFIKWLVDNDKIDFSREGEYCTKSIEEFDGLLRDDVDGLIMILAISNSPIDDLISYLK